MGTFQRKSLRVRRKNWRTQKENWGKGKCMGEQQLVGLPFNKSHHMRALPYAPPQSRPKDIAPQSPITQHQSEATTPGDQTPGTFYHNAKAPHIPLGMPCLQGMPYACLWGCSPYYPNLHILIRCICTCARKVQINSCVDLHVCTCLFVCILSICLKMEGGHQISYLIWAASRGVKGAMGRLSSLRWKKETRRNECERRWKGGWEGKEKGEEESEIKNERNNPRGCLSWSCWLWTKGATNMCCPLWVAGNWAEKKEVLRKKMHVAILLYWSYYCLPNRLIKHEPSAFCLLLYVWIYGWGCAGVCVCMCQLCIRFIFIHGTSRPFASQIRHLMTREII